MHPDGLRELTRSIGISPKSRPTSTPSHRIRSSNVEQEALGSDVNRLAEPLPPRSARTIAIAATTREPKSDEPSARHPPASAFTEPMSFPIATKSPTKIAAKSLDAVKRANERRTDIDSGLFDFIGECCSCGLAGPLETEFVQRFQQFTSPVMAKGVEDTAFYCYNRWSDSTRSVRLPVTMVSPLRSSTTTARPCSLRVRPP